MTKETRMTNFRSPKTTLVIRAWSFFRHSSLVIRHFRPIAFICGFIFLVGCNRGPTKVHVAGSVVYEGKPVPAGEIYFDPDVTKKHDGSQGFARIKDGKFDTREFDKPVNPGPHVVRILGFDGKQAPEAPFGRPLFPEYQTNRDVPNKNDVNLTLEVSRKAGP